jgi:hypothetical protein
VSGFDLMLVMTVPGNIAFWLIRIVRDISLAVVDWRLYDWGLYGRSLYDRRLRAVILLAAVVDAVVVLVVSWLNFVLVMTVTGDVARALVRRVTNIVPTIVSRRLVANFVAVIGGIFGLGVTVGRRLGVSHGTRGSVTVWTVVRGGCWLRWRIRVGGGLSAVDWLWSGRTGSGVLRDCLATACARGLANCADDFFSGRCRWRFGLEDRSDRRGPLFDLDEQSPRMDAGNKGRAIGGDNHGGHCGHVVADFCDSAGPSQRHESSQCDGKQRGLSKDFHANREQLHHHETCTLIPSFTIYDA